MTALVLRSLCPRCAGSLWSEEYPGELSCIHCGHVEYADGGPLPHSHQIETSLRMIDGVDHVAQEESTND